MAGGGGGGDNQHRKQSNDDDDDDFYGVLGLQKDCTQFQLKSAYKKLAMRWHPDRCSSTGNTKSMDEAKKKFQAIQTAYSVLSDETKRFMYDVGVYDNEDDQNNHGMGEFLNEMATMMCENKPNENEEESFEQLQELFEEMFQRNNNNNNNVDSIPSTSQGMTPTPCSSAFFGSLESSCINNKRSCSEMTNPNLQSFCVGAERRDDPREERGVVNNIGDEGGAMSSRRPRRKQRVSSLHDISSCGDYTGISI